MTQKILILDFGAQYTQLIARAVREANVYCEIIPYNKEIKFTPDLKGVILSGSPFSVNEQNAPSVNVKSIAAKVPVLGICYGAQLIAKLYGGIVEKSDKREYGRAKLQIKDYHEVLKDVKNDSDVWMSHSDTIVKLPENFSLSATTHSIPVAAFKYETPAVKLFGLQFHPEVYHSAEGKKIIMALSGGVDSTVAATLIHKAIGKNLFGIFVDNGVLRKDEFQQVLDSCKSIGLNIKGVDAKDHFYTKLAGKVSPEEKRKIIGKCFIEIFDEEAHKIDGIEFLGQGTIYPDVIESMSVHGPSQTIKSHHNVGGLPDYMKLKLVEPLRSLFKDEVRKVGAELGLPAALLNRHPFPGPGLAIRILGEVTEEKVQLLQHADAIYTKALLKYDLYATVWQAGAILLPVKSVGVMGDERTYEFTIALRAVTSVDGMTADWAHLPYDFLAYVSNEIINNVRGINRVVYDISSKPPATIEWE